MRTVSMLAAAVAAVIAVPVIVLVTAATGQSNAGAATPGTPGSACSITVTMPDNGAGSAGGGGGGVRLSAAQMNNARIIVAVVQQRRLPQHAAEISLMSAMDESSLTAIDHGDNAGPDSRGLFQQRDSWEPLSVRMNPAGSTGLFLARMVEVNGWQSADPVQVAHQVQGNANVEDYRRWQTCGVTLAAALWSNTGTGTSVTCTGGDTGAAAGSSKAQIPSTAAHNQLGLPYCWDAGTATGPSHGAGGSGCGGNTVGFDCSGLML